MDIHKPKPVHSWREFLSEIGVIVIGILIALSGEQIVEWLHWKERVSQARAALREEIASSNRSALERIIARPCIDAQLDALKANVLADQPRLKPARVFEDRGYRYVVRHPFRPWSENIWQSVVAGQVTSHFDRVEEQELAKYYNELDHLREKQIKELDLDGDLMAMGSPLPLDPGVRAQLVATIERERAIVQFMDIAGRQQIGRALNLMPELEKRLVDAELLHRMSSPDSTLGWCRANHFPIGSIPTVDSLRAGYSQAVRPKSE